MLSATGTLTGTVFYGQNKHKLSFSATNTSGRFGVKRNAYTENNLIPTVKYCEGS